MGARRGGPAWRLSVGAWRGGPVGARHGVREAQCCELCSGRRNVDGVGFVVRMYVLVFLHYQLLWKKNS